MVDPAKEIFHLPHAFGGVEQFERRFALMPHRREDDRSDSYYGPALFLTKNPFYSMKTSFVSVTPVIGAHAD